MDVEKKILKAMEKFEAVNADTVSAISGIPKKEVHRKLHSMQKYGKVEQTTRQPTVYWKKRKPRRLIL